MPSNQTAHPPGASISLAHHVLRDGEVKSTPGFIAVNRIKKLIKTVGRRGMITVSELIGADPSLAGLERPDILDQIIGYGKFDTMEIGGDVYVSTGIRGVSVPVRSVPQLRQMFIEARAQAGNPPLVAALQGSRWHVDDLARERVWSLRRLVNEVGQELAALDQVNGVISAIRQECSRRAGGEVVQVSLLKSSTPDFAWMATGLLACILATDGSGRQLYLMGKNNRRLIVSPTIPPGKRIVLPEPSIEIEEIDEEEGGEALPPGVALYQATLSPERAAARRTVRRKRLWERILKVSAPTRGRAPRGASWRRRLPRSSR